MSNGQISDRPFSAFGTPRPDALERRNNMQNRFKFRVWDNNKRKYLDNGYIHRIGYLVMPMMKNDYSLAEAEGDFVIEQCTGLKDRNGKLIYEGDILKISSNTDREVISPVVWYDEETGFCVKYKEELFRFNTYRKYHKLEIIGNIHENPELLKESK